MNLTLADFSKGDRVRLSRVLRTPFTGQAGVVHQVIKSRGLVRVMLIDGDFYDAYPVNLDKIAE